jgi:hypothetical protein
VKVSVVDTRGSDVANDVGEAFWFSLCNARMEVSHVFITDPTD